ncbi:hypothetical protein C0J52_15499 [Blattella germanica]|nr:hypothetical protein C0J52_15499 [Blattella germanica]
MVRCSARNKEMSLGKEKMRSIYNELIIIIICLTNDLDVSSYKLSDDEGADSLSTPSSSSRVGSTRVSSSESESDSNNEICDEATNRGRHKKDFKHKQEQHLGYSGLNKTSLQTNYFTLRENNAHWNLKCVAHQRESEANISSGSWFNKPTRTADCKAPPVTSVETTKLETPTITHGENRRNILSLFQKFFTWAVTNIVLASEKNENDLLLVLLVSGKARTPLPFGTMTSIIGSECPELLTMKLSHAWLQYVSKNVGKMTNSLSYPTCSFSQKEKKLLLFSSDFVHINLPHEGHTLKFTERKKERKKSKKTKKKHIKEGTPCFSLIQFMTDKLIEVVDLENLRRRIVAACGTVTPEMLQNTWRELEYRLDVFRVTRARKCSPPTLAPKATPTAHKELLAVAATSPAHRVPWRLESIKSYLGIGSSS